MNKWLKGNGLWCQTCKGSGRGELSDTIVYESGAECNFYRPCPACDGQRRVEAPVADVIANRVPETATDVHTFWDRCIEYVPPKRRRNDDRTESPTARPAA